MKNLIVRSNPVLTDFDRLFDNFFGLPAFQNWRNPAVDIQETDQHYLIQAELPGLSEADVKISVEDNLLVIESAKKAESEKKTENNWLVRERQSYSFRRSFALPKDVDQEAIAASFKDGLLTLEVPKTAKAQPRQIEIKRV
jgi:HSP20 family protein